MSAHGSGMLEALIAVALAAVIGGGVARSLSSLAATAAAIRSADRDLTLVRNVLVSELTAPCGPRVRCPPERDCAVSRRIISGPVPVQRIDVRAGPGTRLAGVKPVSAVECVQ